MQEQTLCLLIKPRERLVCLGYKKRGFGMGNWNGAGGKPQESETIEQAVLRELHEEFCVVGRAQDLQYIGNIEFHFENTEMTGIRGNIFLLEKWEGEPSESEEMRPAWFSFDKLPLDDMWEDDKFWLPQVLEGKNIAKAIFHFDKNMKLKEEMVVEFE